MIRLPDSNFEEKYQNFRMCLGKKSFFVSTTIIGRNVKNALKSSEVKSSQVKCSFIVEIAEEAQWSKKSLFVKQN